MTFVHNINAASGTRQDENIYGRVRGTVRIFCSGNVEDLLQNGKHIDLKPEQEAAIRVRVRRQNVLAIHLSNNRDWLEGNVLKLLVSVSENQV